jgi:hypothetical protein
MQCQEIYNSLMELVIVELVLFVAAGFLALHWRGKWIIERSKHR